MDQLLQDGRTDKPFTSDHCSASPNWRVVFARALASQTEGLASFETNRTAIVAFGVWDGASGDRNGQKSVAQFIELDIGPVDRAAASSDQALPAGQTETGIPWVALGLMVAALVPLLAMMGLVFSERGTADLGRRKVRNGRE